MKKSAKLKEKKLYIKSLTLESVCPECRKTFERVSAEWGYIFKDKKYCSWKCLRAAQRKDMEKNGRECHAS